VVSPDGRTAREVRLVAAIGDAPEPAEAAPADAGTRTGGQGQQGQ
jgi:hypothetical protein